jgi:hypothetical protein
MRQMRRSMWVGGLYFVNHYVQWIANGIVAPGHWRCIARMKHRDEFDDPVLQPVLRDDLEEGNGWKYP